MLNYFTPHALAIGARARGCFACDHFKGEINADHLVCNQREKQQVIGRPNLGCAFWMRAVGADDSEAMKARPILRCLASAAICLSVTGCMELAGR